MIPPSPTIDLLCSCPFEMARYILKVFFTAATKWELHKLFKHL